MGEVEDGDSRDLYRNDGNLQRLLRRRAPELQARQDARLAAFGAWVGHEVDAAAAYTDRHAPPVLEAAEDGDDLQQRLVCNPRYEAVHQQVYAHGIVGLCHGPRAEPALLGFAMGYLLAQADIAIHCPATLTAAVAQVLDRAAPPALRQRFLPELLRMDGHAATGATWVSERQGGSDMGASATTAHALANGFALTGLKWFCSNAAADLALVTARPAGAPPGTSGLGLYLVPRLIGAGEPNRYRLRRLKDKLGTRGLPTAEIELNGAFAHEVAPPPQGFRLMMEALGFSRVHNALAGAGIQRRAFVEVARHAASRRAFGATLDRFPMVRDGLLDLQAALEASVALAFEAAIAFDAAQAEPAAQAQGNPVWSRLVTALAKHRTAEHAVEAASRAIELLGGNGYTEACVTARLLRDAQVLTVWEGPANIQALELLRLVKVEPGGFEAFAQRVGHAIGDAPAALGEAAAAVGRALADCRHAVGHVRERPDEAPRHGRHLLDLMADTLSAALLLEEASADLAAGDARKAIVAARFIRQRLELPAQRGLAPLDDPGQRLFAAVIGYNDVPTAALHARSPLHAERQAS